MPLDIQVQPRGADYLFQGISGGAASLASGAEAAAKQYKQIQSFGKSADAFMAGMGPDWMMAHGIHPEEFKTLGAKDKAAVVQGIMEQQAQQKLQAQNEEMHAQAQLTQQKVSEAEGFGRTMGFYPEELQKLIGNSDQGPTLADAMSPGAGVAGVGPSRRMDATPEMQHQALMNSFGRAGALSPTLQKALAKPMFEMMTSKGDQGVQFSEDPETGARFGIHDKTMMSSGFNPKKLSVSVEPVLAPDGSIVAYSSRDPKGKTTFIKPDRTQLTAAEKAKLRLAYTQRHLDIINARAMLARDPEQKAMYDKDEQDVLQSMKQLDDVAPPAKPTAVQPEGKVVVRDKAGKTFRLPKAQLGDALKQGYTEVK